MGAATKICVWYHCALTLNPEHGINLIAAQMSALVTSGLAEAAAEIHVGCNGDHASQCAASSIAPANAKLHSFPAGQTELTTMGRLQQWLPGHRDWLVCYFHTKGLQYPGNPTWNAWRECMMSAVIWNWRRCVKALTEEGYDIAGPHWMTNEKYPMVGIDQRYFGGNFFWARSDYLMGLPAVCDDSAQSRFEAEVWIGKNPRPPMALDLAPHFPMRCSTI